MPPAATGSSPPVVDEGDFLKRPGTQLFLNPPRTLIIGAGSRGCAYAEATLSSTNCSVAAVAEPIAYKRAEFGRKYIWGAGEPEPEQQFDSWNQWVKYEQSRRERERAG